MSLQHGQRSVPDRNWHLAPSAERKKKNASCVTSFTSFFSPFVFFEKSWSNLGEESGSNRVVAEELSMWPTQFISTNNSLSKPLLLAVCRNQHTWDRSRSLGMHKKHPEPHRKEWYGVWEGSSPRGLMASQIPNTEEGWLKDNRSSECSTAGN